MAEIVLDNRTAGSLQEAIYNVMDAPMEAREGEGTGDDAPATFRYDVFQHFCVQLQRQVAELHDDSSCSFCKIMDSLEATRHVNKDCPSCKQICNGCYELGHNRQSCKNNHRRLPRGFCVMCLMPVDSVYGVHTGRYGLECTNGMKDCLKPVVALLFWAPRNAVVIKVSQLIWPEGSYSKPATFGEYWDWLWTDSKDHVYGILKVLNAVIQCVPH
jgi:hypothetical protein